MPLSGALPLLLLAAAPGPAPAPQITAEEALQRYRGQFRSVRELDCPRDQGEIVVCGRSGPDPNLAPMVGEGEGQTRRLLPGEPPSARGAQNADRMCMRNCEPPKGSILNIIKGVGALLGRGD